MKNIHLTGEQQIYIAFQSYSEAEIIDTPNLPVDHRGLRGVTLGDLVVSEFGI